MKFDVFLSGQHVDLVVLDESVIENSDWYQWFNDQAVCKFLQKGRFPNTRKAQRIFFESQIESSNQIVQLGLVERGKSNLVGVVSLNNIDFINRAADISIVIGDLKSQKLSLSIDAMRLMISHAFCSLNLNRVSAGTFSQDWSNCLIKMLGFELEGLAKQAVYKDSEYRDVFLLAILRSKFKE